MAALPEIHDSRVIDLRDLTADDLEEILSEESLTWRTLLSWDFTASADLVRRFVRIRALNGFGLLIRGKLAGYAYYVCEEKKALIGDVYLLRSYDTPENEDILLSAVLRAIVHVPSMQRIEAQLMMLKGPFERALPYGRYVTIQPRNFMVADIDGAEALREGKAADGKWFYQHFSERRQDEAAELIAQAYAGHVDSTINDQYRSAAGAKRFLVNIVQYPGCGSFFPAGSFLAEDAEGTLAGMCLSSLVANNVGHITQVCVAPNRKHMGIGYELIRRSLGAMHRSGCEKASLTVTASNAEAIQLYQRLGFRAMRRFAAYVWDGF